MAGWTWCGALGNRKRVAYSAKRTVRRKGNRVLGTRFHPDDFSANFDLAVERNPESAPPRMGLFDFFGICRFGGGHGLFHAGIEVRQPDGRKRGPEHSARYLNTWRVFPFWRSPCSPC